MCACIVVAPNMATLNVNMRRDPEDEVKLKRCVKAILKN